MGDWNQIELRPVSDSCTTVIELTDDPTDVFHIVWWANG